MKIRLALVSAVLLLALTGCADTGASAGEDQSSASQQRSSEATPTPSESSSPVVAETPKSLEGEEAEAAFLKDVRNRLPENTQIPNANDSELLTAGAQACEQMLTVESVNDIRLIDGEQPNPVGVYMDSRTINGSAAQFLCPEVPVPQG